jgi:phosphoglucomutase
MKTTQQSLAYQPVELAFGTSGLRGLATDMTDLECYINVIGFIRFLEQADRLP